MAFPMSSEEAIDLMREAVALDPLSVRMHSYAAITFT